MYVGTYQNIFAIWK